ncbi:MAG: hypothetical protein AAFY03_13240, partial [Pseudomonadota bacterium]
MALAAPNTAEANFCISAPHDRICPTFPEDQPDFSRFFEYRVINAAAQTPFDLYAWQAFVSLNWAEVVPSDFKEHPGWRGFHRRSDVFDEPAKTCNGNTLTGDMVLGEIAQSDGHSLIDQNGNFVVFETRINQVAHSYILDNVLTTAQGRQAIAEKINFPIGTDAARPASVTLKTAWTVLPRPDPSFIQAQAEIHIPAHETVEGQAFCVTERVGLIGMHIVAKVASGHGDKWIWATFEHESTAPTAADARRINSIYAKELFPGGCTQPSTRDTRRFLLFDPDCKECPTNNPPQNVHWAGSAPYARQQDGTPAAPSQIVRCWRIFSETRSINTAWQSKLVRTPLEHYHLISAQWRGANPDPIFEQGELPRYLSN